MKILTVEQGSVDWIWARCGIPTASEFDNLVTSDFSLRKGETPNTYLAKKIAEAWGGPLPSFSAQATEQGTLLEPEGKRWYEMEYEKEITPVGFITTDNGLVGCSPDGLIGDKLGIEIKSPNADTHVKYLLAGKVPDQYLPQVHGSMYVTGFVQWKFLCYRRHFPPLVITVDRDDRIITMIDAAVNSFLDKFDAAMKRMEEINGAPRPKLFKPQFGATSETKPEPKNPDVPH
jgi:hypothetical protein